MHFSELNNTILIDKPLGLTSTRIVSKIKRKFSFEKVGHAGTLDPLATGLLIICTGKNTKMLTSFLDYEKEYVCKMELGASTESFDGETEINLKRDYSNITIEIFENCLKQFLGKQTQTPPIYSALKYAGKPLYEYARKGKKIILSKREITISNLQLVKLDLPFVSINVKCSKGTYIRSLVNDIGEKLNCGAYVKELRRVKVGPYDLVNAITFDEIMKESIS